MSNVRDAWKGEKDPVFFAYAEFADNDNFAVEDATNLGQDVVVCVGANYGQGDESGPAKADRSAALGSWMENYRKAVKSLATDEFAEQAWRERRWLEGALLLRPRHFVMTNVVPWITPVAWTKLPKEDTQALLEAASLQPNHLDALCDKLGTAFAVAHGIDDKTRPYVQAAVRKRWSHYLFYANLSHPFRPGDWNDKEGRFSFKRWPKKAE